MISATLQTEKLRQRLEKWLMQQGHHTSFWSLCQMLFENEILGASTVNSASLQKWHWGQGSTCPRAVPSSQASQGMREGVWWRLWERGGGGVGCERRWNSFDTSKGNFKFGISKNRLNISVVADKHLSALLLGIIFFFFLIINRNRMLLRYFLWVFWG